MDNGSLYDQFSNHEAEPLPEKEIGRFANRQDNTKPYIGRLNEPKKEVVIGQHDNLSYYAFNRMVRYAQPISSFEQSVNISFKADYDSVNGKNFNDMKAKYIDLYKRMMG